MTSEELQSLVPQLRRLLEQVAEVLDLRLLSGEERARVESLEVQAEEAGAAGGIVPFVNEGIQKALASEAVFGVLTGPMHADPPHPWTVFLDDDDQVIGEWVPESRLEETRRSGRCIFLSDDFVMYRDRRPRGRGRFVMPFICMDLADDSPFSLVGVGAPSGPADLYLRSLMGNPGEEVATLVLGVRFKDPEGEEEA